MPSLIGWVLFLSKLDMNKAYWQVEIAPLDRHFTGFVTSSGHWIWKRMASGLRNAPATFSRLVAKAFDGLEQFCEAYLEDVLVYSVQWSQHIDHLNQGFNRIKLASLKLNVAKCQFAIASLNFLGHTLSLNMIQPRQRKVDALLKFPRQIR